VNPLIDYIVYKLDGSTDIVSVDAIGSADAVVTAWVHGGHGDREAARHKTDSEMCKTLGLRNAGHVLIDEQTLLTCVPGKLEHAGAAAITRRWMKRMGLGEVRVHHAHVHNIERAVERALYALVKTHKLADNQGNRGQGYTQRDEAYEARAAAATARYEAADAKRAETERRTNAVVEALAALGVAADENGYSRRGIVLAIDDAEKLIALLSTIETRRTA
jgi:hypothetical protein